MAVVFHMKFGLSEGGVSPETLGDGECQAVVARLLASYLLGCFRNSAAGLRNCMEFVNW